MSEPDKEEDLSGLLIEEVKVIPNTVPEDRHSFHTVAESHRVHNENKNPFSNYMEAETPNEAHELRTSKRYYVINQLAMMGFEEKMVVKLVENFEITDVQQGIDMLIKDENNKWPHTYIPDLQNKCEICGDIYANHLEVLASNDPINYLSLSFLNNFEPNVLKDTNESSNDCQICFDTINSHDSYILKCKHIFCKRCLKDYLKEAIENGKVNMISCPDQDCQVEFPESQIRDLCSVELYEKFTKFKKNIEVNISKDHRWCPERNCGRVIENRSGNPHATCVCGFEMCFKCGQEWHPGISCKKHFEKLHVGWSKDRKIQKCPKCNVRIEKAEGCNHMTCSLCNYEWCWICGMKYSDIHFESIFFGCPMLQFTNTDWGMCKIFVYQFLIFLFWPLVFLILSIIYIPKYMCSCIEDWENCYNFCECCICLLLIIPVLIVPFIVYAIMLVPTYIFRGYTLIHMLNRICVD